MFLAQSAAQAFPGYDGFLGTRASVMLDVVFLAMFAVTPIMALSIATARFAKQWQWHRHIQVALGLVLLLAVVAFEIDMQFLTEWELRAAASPYFDTSRKWSCPAGMALLVHLFFAIPTAVLWGYVILGALRRFPSPASPSDYSGHHKTWGRVAAFGMLMTAITGWVFYVMAFVL